MLDINKRQHLSNISVGELKEILEDLDQDYEISLCGMNNFFIHVDDEESIVLIDDSDLNEEYDEY